MPSALEIAAAAYRRRLLAHDAEAAQDLVRGYRAVHARLQRQTARLLDAIAEAEAAGEPLPPSWLFERDRLERLQAQVVAEVARYTREQAEPTIQAAQRAAALLGLDGAEDLVRAALRPGPPGVSLSFARLPAGSVEQLVGHVSDGSPLRSLLDELGAQSALAVRQALIVGVGTGQSPRTVARQVEQATTLPLVRALRISRTEMLRASREAQRLSWQQNPHVVKKWRWSASLSARTCPVCIAMHGQEFPLDEPMMEHPAGRCAAVPVTASWRELGFAGIPEPPSPETGEAWFARQSADTQRTILGPAKYAAFQDGRFALGDLVQTVDDPRWGRTVRERSLRELMPSSGAEAVATRAHRASGGGTGGRGGRPTAYGGGEDSFSPHPVDRLIRELLRSGREATAVEVERIVARVASAPFDQRMTPVPMHLRGVTYQGVTLGNRAPSVQLHLVKRVLDDREWAPGTTEDEYLADLRRAVTFHSSRLVLYERRGGTIVLAQAPTEAIVSLQRRGGGTKPFLIVVYSPDRGILISAYQAPDALPPGTPEVIQWLR